jgi:LysM repeat protein
MTLSQIEADMTTQIFLRTLCLSAAAAALTACSSNPIPKVKLEKRTPKVQQVQSASYNTPTRTKTLPAEAAMVCENANMRARAVDADNSNDTARVMVVQDGSQSSHLLAETVVNCRDYFAHKSAYPTQASTVQTVIERAPETRTITRRRGLTYVVQRGDTVWDIAREHCTSVKAISRLNGLGRANVIDVGDRLELPSEACE